VADQWWTELELPRLARLCDADVLHHPLPASAIRCPVAQVITVHDLAFERLPDGFDPAFRTYARLFHRAAARRAAAVVCVSQTTAADVRERWGVPGERVVVAPHGPGQDLLAVVGARRSHFLYVGDDEPRKNLGGLLAGYAAYRESVSDPFPLVVAGAAPVSATGVRSEDRPGPGRLARLYAEAVALVHPALYEGFGMTPVEAMRLGTPVIAASAPGITEICGDAVRYVDPADPRSIATAMSEVGASPALQDDLAGRGRRRAVRYSWAASARSHLDAYSLAVRR
jgi:glycosyltransferase involved in cell wall biosynthesis